MVVRTPSPRSNPRAAKVVTHVRRLQLPLTPWAPEVHDHMGATISESVLQAGLHYESVVAPRIARLRREHPEATTTSAFQRLLARIDAGTLLSFKGPKPATIHALTGLLAREGVEREEELRAWLEDPEHRHALREVRGVGAKTIDYLKMLCGVSVCAVDVHVRRFLEEAGVVVRDYEDALAVMTAAAAALGIDAGTLDQAVWQAMASRRR